MGSGNEAGNPRLQASSLERLQDHRARLAGACNRIPAQRPVDSRERPLPEDPDVRHDLYESAGSESKPRVGSVKVSDIGTKLPEFLASAATGTLLSAYFDGC